MERVAMLEQNDASAPLALSRRMLDTDRPAEACRYAEMALNIAPFKAVVHRMLARCHMAQRRLSDATAEWRMGLGLEPEDPEVYWAGLARSLAARGKKKKAIEAARKALLIEPELREAREVLQELE